MTIRFYSRVSTEEQAESGIGLFAQADACIKLAYSSGFAPKDWADDRFGEESTPGQYTDGGISAWSVPLHSRPAGKALLAAMQSGDTIIMSRLDRGFRSTIDFCKFVKMCADREIFFICGTPRVNLKTANGRAMAQIYAVLAEWESSIKSERIKEGIASKKREDLNGGSVSVKLSEKTVNEGSGWRPAGKDLKPEPGKTGVVHVYARCSHRSSLIDGYSISSQLHGVTRHAASVIGFNPGLVAGEEFVDGAVSALKISLRERPSGKNLDKALKAGDHVVFLRVDRAFGSSHDFFETIKAWDERGITVHFSEDGSCMADEWGRMLIGVLSHFSEMERRLVAARNKDMRKVLESQGRFCGGQGAPPFWRIHKIKNVQRLILDTHQLLCFRYIKMVRSQGFTKKQACEMLEEHLAKREGRPAIPQTGVMPRGKYYNLPPGFVPRTRKGKKCLIYPLWWNEKVDSSAPYYDQALLQWHGLTTTEKRRIKVICKKSSVFNQPVQPVHKTFRQRF